MKPQICKQINTLSGDMGIAQFGQYPEFCGILVNLSVGQLLGETTAKFHLTLRNSAR